MCWFEDSVVAEAPRPAPKPPAASVPAPAAAAIPLPLSPALVPTAEKEVATEPLSEIPQEVEVTQEDIQAETQVEDDTDDDDDAPATNIETYSIDTEDGKRLELISYVNSSGVRMVEINAAETLQMRLVTLQHCVTAIAQSAARIDETEQVERERQEEFDTCAEITFGASMVFLITIAVSIYIMLVNQSSARVGY